MSEDEALLLAVQQPQRLGVDDYERLREADSCRIDERRLSDVQRRPSCTFPDDVRSATGPVERLEHLGIERVQLRTLLGADANGVRQEEVPHAPLTEESQDPLDRLVEAGQRP